MVDIRTQVLNSKQILYWPSHPQPGSPFSKQAGVAQKGEAVGGLALTREQPSARMWWWRKFLGDMTGRSPCRPVFYWSKTYRGNTRRSLETSQKPQTFLLLMIQEVTFKWQPRQEACKQFPRLASNGATQPWTELGAFATSSRLPYGFRWTLKSMSWLLFKSDTWQFGGNTGVGFKNTL